MSETEPEKQLIAFTDKYSPEVSAVAREALATMRRRFPGAFQLVYDNYNALAIGFGPTDRASDVLFSLALFPRWVSLFFFTGARLKDPGKLLKGSGARVRHIVLTSATMLNDRRVRELMAQGMDRAGVQLNRTRGGKLIIKSISARQRPRRPSPMQRAKLRSLRPS